MTEPADKYARHTSALGLSAGHEEAYRSLERILHESGRFKLVLLQFNDPAYRDALIAKINATATTPTALHVSAATFPDFTDLEARLKELARDHAVIHLTGLESWLFPFDAPTRATGFNYHREAIADNCPAALLLWLTEPDIRDFAVQAPDMWAWRAGVLDFSLVREGKSLDVSPQRLGVTAGLSLAQRVKRINEIRGYLAATPDVPGSLKASLLNELGRLHHLIGMEAEALKYWESALAIYRQIGERRNEGAMLGNIGGAFRVLGQYDKALEAFQSSLSICREAGDRQGEGMALNSIAIVLGSWGKYDEALENFRQSLAISQESSNRPSEASALNNIALIYKTQNNLTEALETYRQSLVICHEINDRQGEGQTLANIAGIDYKRGNLSEALVTYRQSLAICREIGDRMGEGRTLGNIAMIYETQGKQAEALETYRQSLAISRETGDRAAEGNILWNLGGLLSAADKEQARTHLEMSLQLKKDLKDPQYENSLAEFNRQFPPADDQVP